MASDTSSVWSGTTVNFDNLIGGGGYDWYNRFVTVGGNSYRLLHGYMAAGLAAMDDKLTDAETAAAAASTPLPIIRYGWDAGTADADPGAGEMRANNATPASVTTLYLSTSDINAVDVSAIIGLFDDSTSTEKGLLAIGHRMDPAKWVIYAVSGAVTTATGYRKVTVAYVAGPGGFSAADPVALGFARTGNTVRWQSGAGAPSGGTGNDGDYYLNTTTGDVYLKTAGAWGASLVTLKGTNGSTWYGGSGAPSSGLGANGDFYFRTDNGAVYQKAAGAWSVSTNLSGPAGSNGAGPNWGGTSGGSANAQTLTPAVTLGSLTGNPSYEFVAGYSLSGAGTLNVSGTGAVSIRKPDGTAAGAGDLVAGTKYTVTLVGGQWWLAGGGGGASIQQTGPLYAASGSTLSVTGKSVLAAYEQIAGQAFNLDYNTRASYAEQDGTNGTDATGGTFVLHNTAGAVIDSNTIFLSHFDGANGSAEVVDNRGITPFGTSCAYFDGTAYFKIPSSYKVAFGSAQNFTIEGWINTETSSSNQCIFDLRSDGVTGVALVLNASGRTLNMKGYMNLTTAGAYAAKTWHHFAIVRNGGTIKLYMNGAEVLSASDANNYTQNILYLGANIAFGEFVTGWIDQFRVSNTARYTGTFTPSVTEFATDANTIYLFQFNDGHGSQVIRDASNGGRGVDIHGGTISTTRSKFGASCVSLNGGGTRSIIGNPATSKGHDDFSIASDAFTVDGWWYANAVTGTQVLWKAGNDTYGMKIQLESTNVVLYISSNGSSWDIKNGQVIGAVSAATWFHVALTRSADTVYAFVDGALGISFTVSAGLSLYWGASSARWFSVGSEGSNGLVGYADEFRVKRGQAAWTAGFTPPASSYMTDDYTIILLHFEGNNGDKIVFDSSGSSYAENAFGDTNVPILSFAGAAMLDTTYTRGGHSTSLKLNGSSQYASIQYVTPAAGHPIYFAAGEKLCIETWVYFTAFSSVQTVWELAGISANTSYIHYLQVASSTAVPSFYVANASTATGPACSTGWNHIAVVREGRGWVVYTNGVSGSIVAPWTDLVYANEAYNLFIGTYHTPGNYISGAFDAFKITHGSPVYTANFTPATLTQDANTALLWTFNGAQGQKWVKELSKNTMLVSSVGGRTVSDGRYIAPVLTGGNVIINTGASKFGSGSLSCAGADGNYQRIAHSLEFTPSGDFTFEAQVKPASFGASRTIVSKTNGSNTTFTFYINSSGVLIFTYTDTAGASITATGATTLSTSVFTHVAAVRTTGALKLYVGGVQDASVAATNGMRQTDTSGAIFIALAASGGLSPFYGWFDELRISNTARWTSGFTPPTLAYGQQYVSGPYWVATKPSASALDLSAFSSIDSATLTATTPVTTSLLFLISVDGYATALQRWNGSAWVATAYSMTWNGTTLSTSATSSQLNGVANSWAELQTGLLALDASALSSLNIVALLSTANQQFTSALDAITLGMDEYQLMQPKADYSVRRKKANGSQTITFTRVASGNANHVIDYIP